MMSGDRHKYDDDPIFVRLYWILVNNNSAFDGYVCRAIIANQYPIQPQKEFVLVYGSASVG